MAKTSREAVVSLYQTFLARQPVAAEADYYTQRIDSGLLTRAGVAYTFLNAPDYSGSAEGIARLYLAAFNRIPDAGGFGFWLAINRNGATNAQIADIFTRSPEFEAKYGANVTTSDFIDLLYKNVLSRTADAQGKQYWTEKMATGLTRGDVLNSFAQSPELQKSAAPKVMATLFYTALADRIPTDTELASMPTELDQVAVKAAQAANAAGGNASITYSSGIFSENLSNDGTLSNTVTLTLTGDTFKGSVGASLGKVTNTPAGFTATLIKSTDTSAVLSLTGAAKDHAASNSTSNFTVTLDNAAFTSGQAKLVAGATKTDFKISYIDLPLREVNETLSGVGNLSSNLSIDLATDKVLLGASAAALIEGSIAKAKNVDLSEINPPASTTTTTTTTTTTKTVTVSIKGDDQVNALYASGYATSIDGGKGNDTIIAGAAKDTIVFSASSAANGVDTITGFTIGKLGDVLNFAAFLNKTGTTRIATSSSADTTPKAWANGDVLVLHGSDMTPTTVAALFGANLPFAAPTGASKAVIITADIVGDASVWYLVNQTATTNITADEVTLVGVLKDVNNLMLSGFDVTNFA